MVHLKSLGVAILSTMALAVCCSGSASASTLEVGGVTQNASVTITGSLHPELSMTLGATGGGLANTCTASHLHGTTTSPFTGTTRPGGPLSTLSFTSCTTPVTVHNPGGISIDHVSGTTNGTVRSLAAEITTSVGGLVLTCRTGSGTHLGTLAGGKTGHATLEINAVLNCGFLLPSGQWKGTLDITSPTGLGVSA